MSDRKACGTLAYCPRMKSYKTRAKSKVAHSADVPADLGSEGEVNFCFDSNNSNGKGDSGN